ncbi:MAG TPA: hypothetical protein VF316_06580 [Polyangiaceae bacterium]
MGGRYRIGPEIGRGGMGTVRSENPLEALSSAGRLEAALSLEEPMKRHFVDELHDDVRAVGVINAEVEDPEIRPTGDPSTFRVPRGTL